MKKLVLTLFILYIPAMLYAQTATISATVVDSDSQAWVVGSYKIEFYPNPSYPNLSQYYVNGVPLTNYQTTFGANLDNSGAFSQANIVRSDVITPTGSKWHFTICPLASAPCGNLIIPVTGTADISSQITAAIKAPRFTAGYGTYGYNDNEPVEVANPSAVYYNIIQNCLRQYNPITPSWFCQSGGLPISNPSYTGTLTGPSTTITNASFNSIQGWGIRADTFSGATPAAKIVAACNSFGGQPGIVIAPYGMAAGVPASLPNMCHVLDYRGNSLVESYGGLDPNEINAVVNYSTDNTPFNLSPNAYGAAVGTQLAFQANGGGNNSFNGSSGNKSNFINFYVSSGFRTVSQKIGIANNLTSFSSGDTLGDEIFMYQDGGYDTNGDEGTVLHEDVFQQGMGYNDGVGGITKGVVSSINAPIGLVTYTVSLGDSQQGEHRFIRDLDTKYSTGTISNVVNSGGPAGTTITGTGTNWTSIPGFVGTHTTFNNLATGGEILTNNMVLCFDPAHNDGYDLCVPITQGIDATHLVVNTYAVGSQQNTNWPWGSTGTYSIYSSAWPSAWDLANHTFTACNRMVAPSASTCDVSGLTVGHNWDQVLAYNMQFTGMRINVLRSIGFPNRGGGVDVYDQSDAGAGPLGAAYTARGNINTGLEVSGVGNALQLDIEPANIIQDVAPPQSTLWWLYSYSRSDGQRGVGIEIVPDVTSVGREGINIMPNNGTSFPAAVFPSTGGAYIPVLDSATTAPQFYNNFAGALGTVSNLALYSEFDASSLGPVWAQNCAGQPTGVLTITSNAAPDPTPSAAMTAAQVVAPAVIGCYGGGQYSGLSQSINVTAGITYTYSVYTQGVTSTNQNLVCGFAQGSTSYLADSTLVGATGWKRCIVAWKAVSTGTALVGIAINYNNGVSTTFNIWGSQLEQSASAGAYLHTTNVAKTFSGITANNFQAKTISSGGVVNTDLQGQLTLSAATTASQTFTGTYANAPLCHWQLRFNPTTTTYWDTSTTTQAQITFSAAVTGTVNYLCMNQN